MTSDRDTMIPTGPGSMITTVQALNEMAFISGLDEMEVRTRRARGDGNEFRQRSSRSYASIVRQNVFTLINVVLFTIGVVMIAIGRPGDAIASVGLILMNVCIGIYQELKAKRQLDAISLLFRPKVSVMREGEERQLDPQELVRGDVIWARPGDQIVVDGIVVGDGVIEVDESLITGESDHIPKRKGESVLSGSFCVTGSAMYVARRVGERSFANRMAADARTFRLVQTPLQKDVDFVIRVLMLIAILFGLMLAVSAYLSDIPLMRTVQFAAVIAGLVPNGLFFMVIVAYAMGAVRIATRGVLVQQSNSVESLSNVNVMCMDKTGTLTTNEIAYEDCFPVGLQKEELERLLADFAASASSTNRTSEAIARALSGTAHRPVDEVPFSSARKWSALAFNDRERRGTYVLGALEMLEPHFPDEVDLSEQANAWSDRGLRVLAFATNPDDTSLHGPDGHPRLPRLEPLGLLCFSDVLRPETKETLAGFIRAGVRPKIISGDNPHTVAALARQAGLEGELKVVSGPELRGMDRAQLQQVADEVTVFGRITPDQKERLVEVLRDLGYYVAMIGDGVNDVLSLKKANLGVAMQSGSSATRSVADMVLLGDSFAALPPAFLEGQRIINGMRDILRLYLARAIFVVLIILAASVVNIGFPYVPKHMTLAAMLTIGIPTFALAVWARPGTKEHGLLGTVGHFAFPAGITLFLFGFLVYVVAFNQVTNGGRTIPTSPDAIANFQRYAGINYAIYTQDEYRLEYAILHAQTALTTFTVLAGLVLVLFVEPPTRLFVGGDRFSGDKRPTILAGGILAVYVTILAVPSLRRAFELLPLKLWENAAIAGLVVLWAIAQLWVWRANVFERFLHLQPVDNVSSDKW